MEVIFKCTGLKTLCIDQDPQAALKYKMVNFDEADLQRYYAQAQGKDNEPVTI